MSTTIQSAIDQALAKHGDPRDAMPFVWIAVGMICGAYLGWWISMRLSA